MSLIRVNARWMVVCAEDAIFVYDKDTTPLKVCNRLKISALCVAAPKKENGDQKKTDVRQKSAAVKIVDSAFSCDGTHLAVVTTSKHLLVFNASFKNWRDSAVVRHLPKAPTRVRFDRSHNVLVSDRAGSLRKFTLDSDESTELLGHFSMLLDFCLAADERRVLTVDRDEKLRVSRYPSTFVIEALGLGHEAFIGCVVGDLPAGVAATAGGDSTIRLWDVESGKFLFKTARLTDRPIRKLILRSRSKSADVELFALSEDSSKINVFGYNTETKSLDERPSLSACRTTAPFGDLFMDSVYDSDTDTLWLAGRRGIYSANLSKASPAELAELRPVEVENTSELCEIFQRTKDAFSIDQLYRVTGFENMKTYVERKEEKLRKKRKLDVTDDNNENAKNVSAELQMDVDCKNNYI